MEKQKEVPLIGFFHETEEYGCFSNWYPSRFKYAGINYAHVEQFMMYQKVMMFRQYDLAEQIMKTSDPAKCKKIGRQKFPEFVSETWKKTNKTIVKKGIKAKILQNQAVRQKLLDTGTDLLAECSPYDEIWGIGIDINDPLRFQIDQWKGSNKSGQILMEIREEIRQEIAEKGFVQYIDFREATPIPIWQLTAGQLKRIPQYYSVIHAYSDTLRDSRERNIFLNDYSLLDWEIAMNVNMGGGLPISGFFEMKQEVYEITQRMEHTPHVSDVLSEKPKQWGLRGDPWFWEDLKTEFAFDDISITEEELIARITRLFEVKTGEALTEDAKCYVKEYDHGGMSHGHVSGEWIINSCIPLLLDRLKAENNKRQS